MTKRWIAAIITGLALLAWHADAHACTVQVYTINGQTISCLTCCYGGTCTTTCN